MVLLFCIHNICNFVVEIEREVCSRLGGLLLALKPFLGSAFFSWR